MHLENQAEDGLVEHTLNEIEQDNRMINEALDEQLIENVFQENQDELDLDWIIDAENEKEFMKELKKRYDQFATKNTLPAPLQFFMNHPQLLAVFFTACMITIKVYIFVRNRWTLIWRTLLAFIILLIAYIFNF